MFGVLAVSLGLGAYAFWVYDGFYSDAYILGGIAFLCAVLTALSVRAPPLSPKDEEEINQLMETQNWISLNQIAQAEQQRQVQELIDKGLKKDD